MGLRDRKRHVKRMSQMVLRVQRRRTPVSGRRVHRLLLSGRGRRVSGGVGRLDGQAGHGRPGGQRVHRAASTGCSGAGGGGGRLVRVELQTERGGQRRRGHVAAAVVLWTADGCRADPATPGIRRLVHRPGGVLTHWRRDGCGQPVPGMINARPSDGRRRLAVMQPVETWNRPPRLPTTILCNGGGSGGGR